jgi:hypothetical protein
MKFRTRPAHRHSVIALAVALASVAGCGSGGANDSAPTVVETSVLVQDVDGDGRADVLTLGYAIGDGRNQAGELTVYRQSEPGRFSEPEVYVIGCNPWSMTLTDMDGNGRPDLVVADPGYRCADPSTANAVHLLLQDPSLPGRFVPARKIVGDAGAYQAAVADFNGDGLPDIAAGGAGVDSRRLMLSLQDPAHRGSFFQPITVPMLYSPSHVAAGDIDGDGRADLFINLYLGSTGYVWQSALSILLQQPGGGFGAPQQLSLQSGLNVRRLTIADVDGDGNTDLLAHFTPSSSDFQPRLTALLQGASGLGWSAAQDTALEGIDNLGGSGVTDCSAVGDLNGDGQPDLVLVGTYTYGGGLVPKFGSKLNIMRHAGAGRCLPAGTYSLPFLASAVSVGDVNGDGRNDLVVFGDGVVMTMVQSRSAVGTFDAPRPIR